ncbi:unnamed protein product [Penicillium salamii]|nr:unnamed protein product [Penicillium salamii]
MASLSVGDVVLCSQIVYRLLAAATTGRKKAHNDLKELESVLLALNISLGHLQRVVLDISPQNAELDPDSFDIQQTLGFMIHSCRQNLQTLEEATLKYRDTVKVSSKNYGSETHRMPQLVELRSQWRSFIWDFRGKSLTHLQYRQKLETHVAALNLVLNTCTWSATSRIENNSQRQNQRMEALAFQSSCSSGIPFSPMHNVHPSVEYNEALRSQQSSLPPTLARSFRDTRQRTF